MQNSNQDYNNVLVRYNQDFATVNLTTTYVQVTAGVSSDIHALLISSTGAIAGVGSVVEIATGAAASELVFANVAAQNTILVPVRIGANTRIAIRAIAGTINTGQISIVAVNKI